MVRTGVSHEGPARLIAMLYRREEYSYAHR